MDKGALIVFTLLISVVLGIPHHSRNDVGSPFQTAVDGAKQGFPYNPLTQTIKQKPSYNRGSKIVGGQDVEPGQYPFQVTIAREEFQDTVHFCGGAIIDNRHIVTAAQCVTSERAEALHITAGVTSLSEESAFKQTVSGARIKTHPDYNALDYNNDIAIIELDSELTFNAYVNSIALPFQAEPSPNSCVTLGWGLTTEDGDYPDTLQVVDLETVTDDSCAASYAGIATIDYDTQICAISSSGGGKDFCQGDEGGALACNDFLYGISSWGFGCGRGIPGVYTQIFYFKNWILDNTV